MTFWPWRWPQKGSDATENDSIELAVLKNPDIDTDIVFLALLEVTLAQASS